MSTVLQPPPRPRLLSVPRPVTPVLTLREIGSGYRPGRSFVLSIVLHQLALATVLFLTRHALLRPSIIVVKLDLQSARLLDPLILPSLGGGRAGSGKLGGGSGDFSPGSAGVQARSRRGFAYPGPQPIVSDPPRAKLGIQTILQPSLDHLPTVRAYVDLPNIVQPPAPAAPEQRPMVVKGGKAVLSKPLQAAVIAAPKLVVSAGSNSNLAELVEAKPVMPQAVPDAVDAPARSVSSGRTNGLLVLNAVPPAPDVKANIPRAEERSLFAVSPAEVTVIDKPSAGSASAASATTTAGTGGVNGAAVGDAVAVTESPNTSKGVGTGLGIGHGTGASIGDARGAGLNPIATGSGSGRGAAAGVGVGGGSAAGRGSGTGAGSAPGHGGFPGITIQGGRYGSPTSIVANIQRPRPLTSYGMTIESTAGSGGGLPDLGVFHNEKVYTVYLDMRSSDNDHMPSWTLQYAVLRSKQGLGVSVVGPRAPTPPYATLKEVPQFSPDVIRHCAHSLIVASAILGVDGRLKDVAVKQTPEAQIVPPIIQALNNWLFEPARIDGHPVSLKVLLGIRLPIPQ